MTVSINFGVLAVLLIALLGMGLMVAAVVGSTMGAQGWPVPVGGWGAGFYGWAWFMALTVPASGEGATTVTLATPPLDLTLARCPLCGAEEIQLTSDQVQPDALRLTLSCAVCHHAEDAGAVVRHGRDLLPWVLLTWGAVLAW